MRQKVSPLFLGLEGALLLVVALFLLFPTFALELTCFALLLVSLLWLLPLLIRTWSWPSPTPFDVLLLAWAAVLLISILVTADPFLTLPKATGLILGLACWRYMNRAIQSPRLLWVALITWGGLGVGFVLIGALSTNWLTKVPGLASIIMYLPESQVFLPESPDAGVHANQLAGTLLLLIPFLCSVLMALYWSRPSQRLFLGWALLTFIAVVMLLLTQSRTGWVAFAGALCVLCFLWWAALPPGNRRRLFAGCSVAMVSMAILLVVLLGPNRLQHAWRAPSPEFMDGQLNTISFRQEVWHWAIVAVEDFPFTGTGLGSFRVVVRRLYPLNVVPTYDIAHAHNVFLQVALDVGLPGLIIYLAIVGLAFFLGLKAARQDEKLRPYALGLLGGLAALHIFGLADTLALGSKSHLLFWIMLGLITAMHRLTSAHWQKDAPVLSLPVTDP